jgi:hypothetical protein
MWFEDQSWEGTMASEAARSLLEYFRPKETGPGTTGPTGTTENKLTTSIVYRNPAPTRLVPGRVSEREPATTKDGNKKRKENQRLGSEVPVVPVVPDKKSRSINPFTRRSFEPERATLVEYDRKVPLAWTKGMARLLNKPAPLTVTARRWRVFIEDCDKFLGRWGTQAACLGWGAIDLFGMSTACPLGRVDLAGLVWLLDGRDIVALTAETATIRTASGALQTFRRVETQSGQRIAWEEDR